MCLALAAGRSLANKSLREQLPSDSSGCLRIWLTPIVGPEGLAWGVNLSRDCVLMKLPTLIPMPELSVVLLLMGLAETTLVLDICVEFYKGL